MNIPKLKKIVSEKKYHNISLIDQYAWVDQDNILEVLKDPNKLLFLTFLILEINFYFLQFLKIHPKQVHCLSSVRN